MEKLAVEIYEASSVTNPHKKPLLALGSHSSIKIDFGADAEKYRHAKKLFEQGGFTYSELNGKRFFSDVPCIVEIVKFVEVLLEKGKEIGRENLWKDVFESIAIKWFDVVLYEGREPILRVYV